MAKTRMDLTKQIERKEELYSAFDKICSETKTKVDHSDRKKNGAHPLESLVPLLLKSEEENYVVFRTINELNQELEVLELEKLSLEKDVAARADQGLHLHDQEEKVKAGLISKLQTTESLEEKHEHQRKANEEYLLAASEAVTQLFHKLGCRETPRGEALHATGLTERNVADFLGLIEEQLVEVLQLDAHLSALGHHKKPPADPTRPKTPKFARDGKRLPAMALPDLRDPGAGLSLGDGSLDDAMTADSPGLDDEAQPVDPRKLMAALRECAAGEIEEASARGSPTYRHAKAEIAAVRLDIQSPGRVEPRHLAPTRPDGKRPVGKRPMGEGS